jgi:hydrogenase-4 component B
MRTCNSVISPNPCRQTVEFLRRAVEFGASFLELIPVRRVETMEKTALLCLIMLSAASGFVGVLAGRRSLWGQWLGTAMIVIGNIGGLIALASHAVSSVREPTEILRCPTPVPGAEFVLSVDAISAFFLAPILLVTLLGSIYGIEYWKQTDHPQTAGRLQLFYGLLVFSLTILVLARNAVTFLVGWEMMAVSAFFLVGTQSEEDDVNAAAWLYLAASHAATLSLFAMFALLYGLTGSYDLASLSPEKLSPGTSAAVFLLAVVGFGVKAGVMPLHFWLPSAHAMAPSHVSSVMSGVLIKAGIYGLVRITSLVSVPPLWWGELLLVLGAVSAVVGVAFALGQHDLKRLLAYHSIENIGIIVIGLGLALIGRTIGETTWIVLGLSACLLHVWNHALFKSLLFLSAGSVIHACHTREIDELGGLAKTMPWTAASFLLGATAICGLPPLNGFVSEFILYLGIFQTLGIEGHPQFSLASFLVPVLALMGALAVACFVKVFGVVFLGVSRAPHPHPAHEAGWAIRVPMAVLAACCVAIGIGSPLVAPILDQAIAAWVHHPTAPAAALLALAPLQQISLAGIALVALLMLGSVLLRQRIRSQPLNWTETWGCGYAAPTPRMQYTASSLAEMLVSLFSWPLQPSVHRPRIEELFPREARFESHVPEVVLDRVVRPVIDRLGRFLFWFRLVQQGSVQVYLLYMIAILIALLLFGN